MPSLLSMMTPHSKYAANGYKFDKWRRGVATYTLPSAFDDWRVRIKTLFPNYFTRPFSEPHEQLFEWANAIDEASAPAPFVAIWSRGRGKSTTAEAVVADVGIRGVRKYVLYVSSTQEKADKHVANIAAMLQSPEVERYAPAVSRPKITKTGNRIWKRSMLITDTGYAVEAAGLDKGIRGSKLETRYDLVVFDDCDERHDSDATTRKKIETLTETILPAGAPNVAVLFVQNIIKSGSIADRLSSFSGEYAADFMLNRIISGPFPAADDLTYRRVMSDDGTYKFEVVPPTRSLWKGVGLDTIGNEMTLWGARAFLREAQHKVNVESDNALWSRDDKYDDDDNITSVGLNTTRVYDPPDYARVVVAVDPHATIGQTGIIVCGLAYQVRIAHGYAIADDSSLYGATPAEWAGQAWVSAIAHRADCIVVEINQGGDMAINTLDSARPHGCTIPIRTVRASRGKLTRAEPVSVAFSDGRGHIVGHLHALEDELVTWEPGRDSPNRLDAMVWGFTYLGIVGRSSSGSAWRAAEDIAANYRG